MMFGVEYECRDCGRAFRVDEERGEKGAGVPGLRRRECDDKTGPSAAAVDHAQEEAAPTCKEVEKRVALPFVKIFDQDASRMEIRIRRVGSRT